MKGVYEPHNQEDLPDWAAQSSAESLVRQSGMVSIVVKWICGASISYNRTQQLNGRDATSMSGNVTDTDAVHGHCIRYTCFINWTYSYKHAVI